MRKEAAHRHKEPMGGKYSLAAEKWDTVRDSGTVTLLELVTKAYGECSAQQCILVGSALQSAIQQIPGHQNTTISGRQK